MTSEYIYRAIEDERARQERLCLEGKFSKTCATPGVTDDYCIRILTEELGEVARAADKEHPFYNPLDLKSELIQLAACAVAWLERL